MTMFCMVMKPVHTEVIGNGARRLPCFNLSTPLRPGNFNIFPIQTPKRAEARAPNDNFGMHGYETIRREFMRPALHSRTAPPVREPSASRACRYPAAAAHPRGRTG